MAGIGVEPGWSTPDVVGQLGRDCSGCIVAQEQLVLELELAGDGSCGLELVLGLGLELERNGCSVR